jgi:hypothetical protein
MLNFLATEHASFLSSGTALGPNAEAVNIS